jgi:hypothetical protein
MGNALMEEMMKKYKYDGYNYYYLLNFGWVIVFTSALTVGLFYAFPKNRKFPSSVAIWATIIDAVYYLREMFKWGPYNRAVHLFFLWTPTETSCKILFAW